MVVVVSGLKYIVCPLFFVATPAAQSCVISCVTHPSVIVQLATFFSSYLRVAPVCVLSAGEIDYLFVKTSSDRQRYCVRSFVCLSLPCVLFFFPAWLCMMWTYLIRRRCDTLCHIVSPLYDAAGAAISPVAILAVICPNICPSSSFFFNPDGFGFF